MIGNVAATGGNVLFAGEVTRNFLVFNANCGKVPFRHKIFISNGGA
jgi:hypothetical protein